VATKISNVVWILSSLISPSTLTQTVNADLDDAIVSSSGGGEAGGVIFWNKVKKKL
jgi:hypothetical protein